MKSNLKVFSVIDKFKSGIVLTSNSPTQLLFCKLYFKITNSYPKVSLPYITLMFFALLLKSEQFEGLK